MTSSSQSSRSTYSGGGSPSNLSAREAWHVFFRYAAGGKEVVFLVAKDKNGDIKTAFDACITCYRHKQGYTQDADCVVCTYCGTTFDIEKLDKGLGNCVPIRIKHQLEGDTVTITQAEIEAGEKWF